mmetsp:Transcript_4966/g.8179  ORF Transcript_4966/g.8179 Transcript_4966/m.8179 type:complete len:126 (-) Transcript_4966:739-1116(-)
MFSSVSCPSDNAVCPSPVSKSSIVSVCADARAGGTTLASSSAAFSKFGSVSSLASSADKGPLKLGSFMLAFTFAIGRRFCVWQGNANCDVPLLHATHLAQHKLHATLSADVSRRAARSPIHPITA